MRSTFVDGGFLRIENILRPVNGGRCQNNTGLMATIDSQNIIIITVNERIGTESYRWGR